jgi:hypothetical protein
MVYGDIRSRFWFTQKVGGKHPYRAAKIFPHQSSMSSLLLVNFHRSRTTGPVVPYQYMAKRASESNSSAFEYLHK